MVLSVVKPDIVINVKDLETKIKTITILKAYNNSRTLCTYLEELRKKSTPRKERIISKMILYLPSYFVRPRLIPTKNLWVLSTITKLNGLLVRSNIKILLSMILPLFIAIWRPKARGEKPEIKILIFLI